MPLDISPGSVSGGSPVRSRRGPATVIGGARRTTRSARQPPGEPSASREGAAGSIPQARKPIPTGTADRPRGRGGSFMKILSRGLTAAALLAALAAAPAYADTAHVRIEGDGVSLTKTVDVPTSGEIFSGCPYDTAAGAIEVAT